MTRTGVQKTKHTISSDQGPPDHCSNGQWSMSEEQCNPQVTPLPGHHLVTPSRLDHLSCCLMHAHKPQSDATETQDNTVGLMTSDLGLELHHTQSKTSWQFYFQEGVICNLVSWVSSSGSVVKPQLWMWLLRLLSERLVVTSQQSDRLSDRICNPIRFPGLATRPNNGQYFQQEMT